MSSDDAFLTAIIKENTNILAGAAWAFSLPGEVDDIIQAACLELSQHVTKLKQLHPAQQRAYIYKVVYYKAKNHNRSVRRFFRNLQMLSGQLEESLDSFEMRVEQEMILGELTPSLSLPPAAVGLGIVNAACGC